MTNKYMYHLLLKKDGFIKTMLILDSKKMEASDFFSEYTRNSYYNSFYRVMGEMVEQDLIIVELIPNLQKKRLKSIQLTEKGLEVQELLMRLIHKTEPKEDAKEND